MPEKWLYEYGKEGRLEDYKLSVALCFPEKYKAGMANLGFLWIYHLLNGREEVRCDRSFIPDRKLNKKQRLETIESGRPLSEYDVVAFSLPYEGGYVNAVRMLSAGGIEPRAGLRRGLPIVIAGGVAISANPEPMADFFDAVIVGDAENVLDGLVNALIELVPRSGGSRALDRRRAHSALAALESVYAPSLYEPVFDSEGRFVRMEAPGEGPEKVRYSLCDPIVEAPHSPVITDRSAFPGSFLIELSRGCPYKCRFCLASHAAEKFRPAKDVLPSVRRGLDAADRIGLIGTAFTRSAQLEQVLEAAAAAGAGVSFSSIRIDRKTLSLLSRYGDRLDLKSIAVAPEAASPKLRKVVGKDISADMAAFIGERPMPGLENLRLYYLAGIPGESDEDALAIVEEAASVGKGTGCGVLVSVTPMVPKPHTPMQWMPMAEAGELKRKRKLLKKAAAKVDGVELKVESIDASIEQAALSRGDRRAGRAILQAALAQNRRTSLLREFESCGIDISEFTGAAHGSESQFPWDVITHGGGCEKLYGEFLKALEASKEE